MKKEKTDYRFNRYEGKILQAKKEIPFEIKLMTRLVLDELCFNWNKKALELAINSSIDRNDKETFLYLSEMYKQYMWE